ncbi:MAG TPA: CDP-alcohol phosphatidyltransferase family protein [Bryobacteraceae bacterium]|nr:CDP-alcohol phosphatidyltransferase family protein [Bryobacteraceae bacterium]
MIRHVPNAISFARLCLVPVVLSAILNGDPQGALIWLGVAGMTDALDGFLARRLGVRSRTGAYLDPIADKCLLSGVYFALACNRTVPWWLTAIVFGRDAVMLIFIAVVFLFTAVRDFPPTVWGKLSTAVQIVTGILLLLEDAIVFHPASVQRIARAVEQAMIGATAAATLWSAVDYLWIGIGMLRRARVVRA